MSYRDRIRLIEQMHILYYIYRAMSLYHIFSLIKMSVAVLILLSLYFTIDPYADPLIALSWGMVGFFLLAWWCSFFFFWAWNKYISKTKDEKQNIITSYKLSLLFGVYILFNIIFLLNQKRTVLGGIVLLIGFIIIQAILLPASENNKNK
jgi:hypothetical protein